MRLKPLIIIGGGGHASVLVDLLRSQGREILGVVSPDDISNRSAFEGLRHYRNDEDVLNYSRDEILLVNGIGALPRSDFRKKLSQYYSRHGFMFESVISQFAHVSDFAQVESGGQVLTGAIVQAGARIGSHTIINTGAIVEHDCEIGDFNHVAPGAVLCGHVSTGNNVYIGGGVNIVPNVKIKHNSVIGAGALIIKDITESQLVIDSKCQIRKRINNDR